MAYTIDDMQTMIEVAFEKLDRVDAEELRRVLADFTDALDRGQVRAASRVETGWKANTWVKKGILLLFRLGQIQEYSINQAFRYFDKSTLPLKSFAGAKNVRLVPGGSSVRSGSYLGKNVVIMPPSYVNVGAYVDDGAMIDSHALVGSCAQVGKNVHLSAAAQLGGVLEPVGSVPVVIEDHVMIGGHCGVFEGTLVGANAVLGAGVILTRSTPVFDCVKAQIYRASATEPLKIPAGAVVIPGSRPLRTEFAQAHQLAVNTPIIIKYRDASTDAATILEEALR